MWAYNWLPANQSFQYVDRELPGVGGPIPAPDLNMLIAPAYAWMYHQTGSPIYQQQADAIFRGGVEDAYLEGAKQFNQNYLRLILWRGGTVKPYSKRDIYVSVIAFIYITHN